MSGMEQCVCKTSQGHRQTQGRLTLVVQELSISLANPPLGNHWSDSPVTAD
jgi:hypothetical protein